MLVNADIIGVIASGMDKRTFIKTIGLAGLSLPFSASANTFDNGTGMMPEDQDAGESYWKSLRKQYALTSDYINLENGYYNIVPQATMQAHIEHIKTLNREGSYYMRTKMADNKIRIRQALAGFLNCPAEEVVVTRNTTESMDTVICGFDWKPGDEAIMAEQDYGSMLDMFRQQARRYGMVNKVIQIPLHPESDEEIVALYEKAISPKTRLMMLSHMINISGQILPVKKIADMAHKYGVKVLVDGAHAVGHFEFNIADLNCDYYAASLHKWLSVPLGAGLLYVKKECIKDLWPLFGESAYADDDIRKLNHTGTIPIHIELSIPAAIEFHNRIGGKRKEDRLRYLQTYWTGKLRGMSGIHINTPAQPERACAIANIGLSNMKPAEFSEKLFKLYGIWTVAIDSAGVHGCRITPNVYTTTEELDRFTDAVIQLSKQ